MANITPFLSSPINYLRNQFSQPIFATAYESVSPPPSLQLPPLALRKQVALASLLPPLADRRAP